MKTRLPNTNRITIIVSDATLRDIDRLIPDRRPVCRERFVLDALEAHLFNLLRDKPVTKAIAESTDDFIIGRA